MRPLPESRRFKGDCSSRGDSALLRLRVCAHTCRGRAFACGGAVGHPTSQGNAEPLLRAVAESRGSYVHGVLVVEDAGFLEVVVVASGVGGDGAVVDVQGFLGQRADEVDVV